MALLSLVEMLPSAANKKQQQRNLLKATGQLTDCTGSPHQGRSREALAAGGAPGGQEWPSCGCSGRVELLALEEAGPRRRMKGFRLKMQGGRKPPITGAILLGLGGLRS